MSAPNITDPLLQLLIDQGLLEEAQLPEIMEEHQQSGKPFRTIILDMQLMTEDQLLEIIAGYLGTSVVNLPGLDVPSEVIRSVPSSLVRMHNMVPVEAGPSSVKLVTFDIVSPQIMDEIQFILTRDISFVVARESDIRVFINQFYSDESVDVAGILETLERDMAEAGDSISLNDEDNDAELAAAASAAPVVRFVNLILYQAASDRASDVHFEPFEHEFRIRYRVDGTLYEMAPPPRRLALPVISRIKVMANLDIAERRLPQDGRIQVSIGGKVIDLRVSTLPTQFGESVVLRILDRSAVSLEIESLGMPEDVYETYIKDIQKPNGILVITGPTGCGKTTTLYSGLKRVNTIETKILTAEQPVEYDIEGIMQVPIEERVGNSFARTLRAFLRQDPDVMMVGEIRDQETAMISIQASLTGHLVFTTLHTNDAAGAVTRLIDMGIEPFLISSTLEAVLAQRLVRTICEQCRASYTPDAEDIEKLGLTTHDVAGIDFYKGQGCKNCGNIGYKGRKGIFEYLSVTDPIRDLINERRPTLAIRNKAVELGMRTIRQDGLRNIIDGYTTPEEVLKYT